ncbi:hypothetical protein LPJ60_005352 [Coemansia sp. RSA 2675]|nr:hypothetical protein LPJ60_005352 [Coemansia sp. RSA 2675]
MCPYAKRRKRALWLVCNKRVEAVSTSDSARGSTATTTTTDVAVTIAAATSAAIAATITAPASANPANIAAAISAATSAAIAATAIIASASDAAPAISAPVSPVSDAAPAISVPASAPITAPTFVTAPASVPVISAPASAIATPVSPASALTCAPVSAIAAPTSSPIFVTDSSPIFVTAPALLTPAFVPDSAPTSDVVAPTSPADPDAAPPATELALFDGSGAEVTSAGLRKAMGIFIFAHVDVLADAYRLEHGCPLTQLGLKPSEIHQKLGELEGVECWEPRQRVDDERGSLGRGLLAQLGLLRSPDEAVLAPVLCCTLAAICGTRVDRLSGPLLAGVFKLATGIDTQSLRVVTRAGTKALNWCHLCNMLQRWVDSLAELTSEVGLASLLAKAAACTALYERQCVKGLGRLAIDFDGRIAQQLLADDASESQLLLGIGQAELRALAARLALIVSKDTSPHVKGTLLHLSESEAARLASLE